MGRGPVIKKVFVTIHHRGVRHNFLCDAYQEGNRFKITQTVLEHLLDQVGVRRGDTYSMG
jgi:hypothetical protein